MLFGCCLLEACSFLLGDRAGVDLEERGSGEGRKDGGRGNYGRDILNEKVYFQ